MVEAAEARQLQQEDWIQKLATQEVGAFPQKRKEVGVTATHIALLAF